MSLNPIQLISKATKAVPAVKYAVGILGLVAVIAVIKQLNVDLGVAAIGTIVLLGLMVMLLVFAKLSMMPGSSFQKPALVLMWAMVLLFIAICILLIWSAFFNGPKIQSPFASDHQATVTAKPGSGVKSDSGKLDVKNLADSLPGKELVEATPKPLMEFTLSAFQTHVINQWRATLEINDSITTDRLISLRIWRDVAANDTSAVDPHAAASGQELQTLRIGRNAPITITDVGDFNFLATEPVISNHKLRSIILKIYKRK